jgi:hypothetical protein
MDEVSLDALPLGAEIPRLQVNIDSSKGGDGPNLLSITSDIWSLRWKKRQEGNELQSAPQNIWVPNALVHFWFDTKEIERPFHLQLRFTIVGSHGRRT